MDPLSSKPRQRALPRTVEPDCTLALLREGYDFVGSRCRRYGSDSFRTRLLLEDVLCISGAEAAEFFYAAGRFSRRRAVPLTVVKLLQDKGSVQSLEEEAHLRRKALFLAMTTGEEVARLRAHFHEVWERRVAACKAGGSLVLYDDLRDVLTEAACAWAGIPLGEGEVARRSRELSAMIDGAGSFGPRMLQALYLRRRSERWLRDLVRGIRDDGSGRADAMPLYRLACYRDLDGRLLPAEIAAVELLNLLRPIAAVANFMTFVALALHQHPEWRERFARGEEDHLDGFVQEVRRLSPFFPLVGGRARAPFKWHGQSFPQNQWVVLDLYGTCRDPRVWAEPEAFRPERHERRALAAPGLVPQGGGEHASTHRCPGEWFTVALMKDAVRGLTRSLRYDVPPQDLSVRLSRMPARPKSGFIITAVRRRS